MTYCTATRLAKETLYGVEEELYHQLWPALKLPLPPRSIPAAGSAMSEPSRTSTDVGSFRPTTSSTRTSTKAGAEASSAEIQTGTAQHAPSTLAATRPAVGFPSTKTALGTGGKRGGQETLLEVASTQRARLAPLSAEGISLR